MSCGVPVITSNISSLPEVAGDAAILVDPNNTFEIADAMSQLYYNKTIRDTMILKGLKRAAMFSWDKTAQLIYDALRCLH
jgi:glycosyltransferase involved in cell wall biosynthesis